MTGSSTSARATDEHAPSVLFLLSSLATGGSELKTVRLANALASRGIGTTLAYLQPPLSLLDRVAPEVALVHLQRRGKLSMRALRLLARVIRERHVRTAVAVNPYPALYLRLAQCASRNPRFRFVATVNTTDIHTRKLALQMHLYRHVLRSADLVIFGAQAQLRIWRAKYGVGADARRTRVLYNGVDTERFAPMAGTPQRAGARPSSALTIGTVGQLRAEKSHVDLVRATAILRSRGFDVRALIVGDGPERPRIVAEIHRLGLDSHVTLAGEVRDVRPCLRSMDVFVLPSISETFSNAALEALSSGIPVVASDIGGIRELLSFGGGVTYPPGDAVSCSERLAVLLTDRERRLAMGVQARLSAEEHFSWSRMVQEFIAILAPRAAAEAAPYAPAAELDITGSR